MQDPILCEDCGTSLPMGGRQYQSGDYEEVPHPVFNTKMVKQPVMRTVCEECFTFWKEGDDDLESGTLVYLTDELSNVRGEELYEPGMDRIVFEVGDSPGKADRVIFEDGKALVTFGAVYVQTGASFTVRLPTVEAQRPRGFVTAAPTSDDFDAIRKKFLDQANNQVKQSKPLILEDARYQPIIGAGKRSDHDFPIAADINVPKRSPKPPRDNLQVGDMFFDPVTKELWYWNGHEAIRVTDEKGNPL